MERQTGQTTEQIRTAPEGATYVWCNEHIMYPHKLAQRLGRTDLHIVGPAWVRDGLWHGTTKPVVIDHAYYFLNDYWDLPTYEMQAYLQHKGRLT